MNTQQTDAVVVGGGLAGLAAALYLARAGRSTVVLERAADLGGRARTKSVADYAFNLGPHALYRAGRAAAILRELGISYGGRVPAARGLALRQGRVHRLPVGALSLFATGVLGPGGKIEFARLLGSLPSVDTRRLAHVPLSEWFDAATGRPEVRDLLGALTRVATYSHDPERMSAGAALDQVQRALRGSVLYLDGGWQVLVDGLRRAAEAAGVRMVTRAAVVAVERDGGGVKGVRLGDGMLWRAPSVVLAVDPHTAARLVDGEPSLAGWAASAVPVRAATLDVALSRLPRPRATFALGVDTPVYFSVHSAAARLASPGGALVHVARYLGDAAPADPRSVEQELCGLLDRLQPCWREAVVHKRFLPNLVVSHALPLAAQGGTQGRPGPDVPGVPGLFVAGDWVGAEGLLADAALASAREAAAALLAEASRRSAAA